MYKIFAIQKWPKLGKMLNETDFQYQIILWFETLKL